MEDIGVAIAKSARSNPYNNHGLGCSCSICGQTRGLAKRDTGANEEKKHLALAQSYHHSAKQQEHNQKLWGENGRQLPVEKKAKHLEAADAHGMAADHFRSAARAYEENLPKSAAEHEGIAATAAEKANKLSEKADAI